MNNAQRPESMAAAYVAETAATRNRLFDAGTAAILALAMIVAGIMLYFAAQPHVSNGYDIYSGIAVVRTAPAQSSPLASASTSTLTMGSDR